MADEASKGGDLLLAFADHGVVWGDDGGDQGIKRVVERAGLDWSAASGVIDNTGQEGPMEENRLQMMASDFGGAELPAA